jgi:hypothetical protein
MPKRYITRKQNGGGFLDFFKKPVSSTTSNPSNGGGFLDFFKKNPIPSTTSDSSNVPSTTSDPLNNNVSKTNTILSQNDNNEYSDNYLDYDDLIKTRKITEVTITDASIGKLYFCTSPGTASLVKILSQNDDTVKFKIIKGASEGLNDEIKKKDRQFYEPIIKKFQTGGKRKSRRNKKSRQNQRKKSRQSRRR